MDDDGGAGAEFGVTVALASSWMDGWTDADAYGSCFSPYVSFSPTKFFNFQQKVMAKILRRSLRLRSIGTL